MNKYDEILDEAAKRNMLRWDIEKFKLTHPRLYRTIIESLRKIDLDK